MTVIADDLTGAAEIAGLAFAEGVATTLVIAGKETEREDDAPAFREGGLTVIATDTRSMSCAEAVEETRRVARWLKGAPAAAFPLFKKTDSALRGHVVAELRCLMQQLGYRRAAYLPANPSKGRTVSGGVYYIQGCPIAQTHFSFDPEFPALTSSLAARFPDAAGAGIFMPDAVSTDEIALFVRQLSPDVLPAGAADFFAAWLAAQHFNRNEKRKKERLNLTASDSILVCGSTQSTPPRDWPVAPLPLPLYEGVRDLALWDTSAYARAGSVALTIPFRHRTDAATARHLRQLTARAVARLISERRPSHLFIEGGATAFAILRATGLTHLEVTATHGPGVVSLRGRGKDEMTITMKPGSYSWDGDAA